MWSSDKGRRMYITWLWFSSSLLNDLTSGLFTQWHTSYGELTFSFSNAIIRGCRPLSFMMHNEKTAMIRSQPMIEMYMLQEADQTLHF